MKKKLTTALAIGTLMVGSAGLSHAASYADIAFVVDQSGSMYDEFQWLSSSITSMQNAMSTAGITTNYGLAGYEYYAGTESSLNAWSDLSSNAANSIAAADYAKNNLYGYQERGYHAAEWAINGFSWTGGDYAKVVVLITDEYGDQGSGIGESALGTLLDDNGVLLNVITYQSLYADWDEAVYDQNDTSYSGLFDLGFLQSDPAGFTAAFTAAKIQEIQDTETNPVPEPATMLLMGTGLSGLIAARRRKAAKKA